METKKQLPKNQKKVPQESTNPKDFYLKIHVEFGSRFSNQKLNRGEFVNRLREGSEKWKNDMVGKMMEHFADHIEGLANDKTDKDKSNYLSWQPVHSFNAIYDGCGDNNLCPSDKRTCQWQDDEGNWHVDCPEC